MSNKGLLIHGQKIYADPLPGSNYGCVIIEKMRQNDQKIYQIDPETDEKWTYAQTADYVIRVALELRSRGIGPGKIVTLVGYNSMPIILPAYSCFLLGATSNPIHPLLDECIFILQFAPPDILFCDEKFKQKLEKVLRKMGIQIPILTFENDFGPFLDEKHQSKVASFKIPPVDPATNVAMILCTSGTTGNTKGVPITHNAFYESMISGLSVVPRIKETVVFINYALMSWMTAPMFHLIVLLLAGQKIVANYDPIKHFKLTDKYKVNWIMANPNFITEVIHHPKFSESNMGNLMKVIEFGGSAASHRQIDEFYECFPNAVIQNGLGSTEFGGFHIVFNGETQLDLIERNRYALGYLAPNLIGKLVDINTEEIISEPNRSGELYLKGPSMFKGYLNRPDLNQDLFDSDGFYRTGDIFLRNEEGVFTFVGRNKEIFKYQHHKIDPLDIENVLSKHPAVYMVSVIGKPDPFNVELPMAFVIKKPGFEKTSEEEIIKFVEDQVEEYQRLRGGIMFLNTFPITTTGKVRKNELRKLIL